MDHCTSHPLRLLFCPGPRDAAIRPPRPLCLTVAEYFTLEHGCMNAGGGAGSATAQPPRVPNQARLPFRPWQQKLEVESPGQFANRAVQAVLGAQPSHLIQINGSGESGGITVPKRLLEVRSGHRFRTESVFVRRRNYPRLVVLQKITLSMPESKWIVRGERQVPRSGNQF
jgi:hypothetical protein